MKSSGNFSIPRIRALTIHQFYVSRHSLEIFFDIVFFPLINIILFGLISKFLSTGQESSANFLIVGVLLWEIVTIIQYNVTVSALWEVWSHNLTNIFTAPISIAEYMIAHIFSGALKTFCILVLLAGSADLFFHFNLLSVGIINLMFFAINLALFAVWIGIILLGYIFRYGTRMAAISWGLIFLFQPLTAAFFPLSVLPHWLQAIAKLFPATYVFEDARKALSGVGILWRSSFLILLANLLYLFIAIAIFKYLFGKSKETGQFARNDLG